MEMIMEIGSIVTVNINGERNLYCVESIGQSIIFGHFLLQPLKWVLDKRDILPLDDFQNKDYRIVDIMKLEVDNERKVRHVRTTSAHLSTHIWTNSIKGEKYVHNWHFSNVNYESL